MKPLIVLLIAISFLQVVTWLPRKILHITHNTAAAISDRSLLSELWLERIVDVKPKDKQPCYACGKNRKFNHGVPFCDSCYDGLSEDEKRQAEEEGK